MGRNLVLTNLRLPAEVVQALKFRAVREHKSLAQLIREAIEHTFDLPAMTRSLSREEFRRKIDSLVGVAKGNARHAASRHDAIYDE